MSLESLEVHSSGSGSHPAEARRSIMILWEHQRKALDFIENKTIREPGRSLVVMPPGAGKSEVACQALLGWLRMSTTHRAVVCVPARRLLGQYYQRLCTLTREPIAFEQGARRPSSAHRIVLASQLSLIDRLPGYSSNNTLMIIDEVHHSNYDAPDFRRVLSRFDRTIGLSATPWTQGMTRQFPNVYFYSLTSAVSDKVICPVEVHAAVDLSPSGECHTLVFVASNAEARSKSARFSSADWIGHSRNDSENLSAISRWRNRNIETLFVNRMLLEGYDTPETSAVWIDHRLDSVVMCAQIVGRALRYKPQKTAKVYVTCPDTLATVSEALQRMQHAPR